MNRVNRVISVRLSEKEIKAIDLMREAIETGMLGGSVSRHSLMRSIIEEGVSVLQERTQALEGVSGALGEL